MTDHITITGRSGDNTNLPDVLRGYVERFELSPRIQGLLMLEAANEIERLRADGKMLADRWTATHAQLVAEYDRLRAEIDRLRLTFASCQETGVDRNTPEEAYLQIVEGWLRNNRDIHFPEGAVDDLCERISRRALEPKP